MERLTERDKYGNACLKLSAVDRYYYSYRMMTIAAGSLAKFCGVIDRLAAYEDTGFTPEEIQKLKEFKSYFDDMYGKGLEVANWHMNGNLESFDNFYESAIDSKKDSYNADK